MKIESIHLREAGPLLNYHCDFKDQWQGGLQDRILFSGPNGSGKSTLFRAVAHLWQLAGFWLSTSQQVAKQSNPSRKWLCRCQGAAVIFDTEDLVQQSVSKIPLRLGIYFGHAQFLHDLRNDNEDVSWLGETLDSMAFLKRAENPLSLQDDTQLIHRKTDWLDELSNRYRRLVLTEERSLPNIVHLDSEERRWVAPTEGLGEIVPDDPDLRWLVNYRPREEWKGQVESSLIALKTIDQKSYERVLADINKFLAPKTVGPNPDSKSLRLPISDPNEPNRKAHTMDDLSSGEHQILIQLYLVSRWLNHGGIVMIDEPDLHLHPSLLNSFLACLESIIAEREGQLLLTSHNPEVWERYENKGLRIQLDAKK